MINMATGFARMQSEVDTWYLGAIAKRPRMGRWWNCPNRPTGKRYWLPFLVTHVHDGEQVSGVCFSGMPRRVGLDEPRMRRRLTKWKRATVDARVAFQARAPGGLTNRISMPELTNRSPATRAGRRMATAIRGVKTRRNNGIWLMLLTQMHTWNVPVRCIHAIFG